MAYVKFTWTSGTLISARQLRHIETQYDEIMNDYTPHNHDLIHYLKDDVDLSFWNEENDGAESGLDVDTLDGLHATEIIGSALPIGAVIAWHDIEGNIPNTFHICDGGVYNGYQTPDLRAKFVVGAGGTYNPFDSGGADEVASAGNISIDTTAITESMVPRHRHTYSDMYCVQGSYTMLHNGVISTATYNTTVVGRNTFSVGGGQPHGHLGSTYSGAQKNNIPPYYTLYYIMKIA